MIYMVELKFTNPDLEERWNEWYSDHLAELFSVPGFRTSQRFKTDVAVASPYLAIYSIASGNVLESPAYTAKGGRASADQWKEFMTNWHRNLFDGLDVAPPVPLDERLVVIDRTKDSDLHIPSDFARLACVGLDQTVVERGMKVCRPEEAVSIAGDMPSRRVRVFEPMIPQLRAG